MVATRRGARTDATEEPEAQKESLTLRKKPVRRATAATAATTAKTSQPTARTRATRSKKPEIDDEDELAISQKLQETSKETEPTTKRATRSKKVETVEPDPSRAAKTARPTAQPKRTTRTATVKSSDTAREEQPAQVTPAAPEKPALAARPARQTRAKTPAAQSPLSPKKITQVSRARTRGAKVTDEEKAKPAQRTRPVPATQASRTSRKRAVSDENAGIPDSSPAEPDEVPTQPAKFIAHDKGSSVTKQLDEDEESLSSRATTPLRSPGPVFEQPKDYTEDRIDAADLEQVEDEDENVEQLASDDELCGPKTPMRRTRKAQSQLSNSSRKNVKQEDPEVPVETPPRRRGARGTTPQTQVPYNKAGTSNSVIGSMTVARANDRPFVFRELQSDSAPAIHKPAEATAEDEEAPMADIYAGHDDGSEQKAEDIVEMAKSTEAASEQSESDHAQDLDETIVIDDDSAGEDPGLEPADSPLVEPPTYSDEHMEKVPDEEATPLKPQFSEENLDNEDSPLIEPPVEGYEHEDEMELDSPTAAPPVASYEVDIDGSVIIHSRDGSESAESSEDEQNDHTEFGLKTPRPETILWQNIREDTTIPIDFDLHFADVRTPARVDDDFSYGAASVFQTLHSGTDDLSLEPEQDLDHSIVEPTMSMNDFVDIAALSEPTVQLDTVPGATHNGYEDALEGEIASNEMDKTEDTVIITKAESPAPEALQLVEIEGHSCDAAQGEDKLRSGMMRESLEQSAAAGDQMRTETGISLCDEDAISEDFDESVPHYAWSTLSSRRKSLPAIGNQTPVRSDARPTTSDGSSVAGAAPLDRSSWTRSRRSSAVAVDTVATPVRNASKRRPSSAKRSAAVIERNLRPIETPSTQRSERFPRRVPRDQYDGQIEAQTIAAPSRFRTPNHAPPRYPATIQKLGSQESQSALSFDVPFRCRTPSATPTQRTRTVVKDGSEKEVVATNSSAETVPHATPQERFPRRSARQAHDQQASTVAPPARFHTPIQGKPIRPATVQRLTSQNTAKAESFSRHATPTQTPRGSKSQNTPSAATPSAVMPQARFPRLPPKETYEVHVDTKIKPQPATPQARFPRLPPKQTYNEHANTVIAPSRFRSPAHASPRRPATSQKPVNLRKVALKSAAPGYGSHTPVKTPLKAPAETPSQVPMTPHPGAPLRGVVALVEVFTLDGASASAPFVSLLQRLGARTTKTWSERVTHVIFKDGSPTTLQRVRLNNKEVESTRKGFTIHCVNSRWVSDCDASGSRVDEDDDAYAVDVTEVPRGGNRRRKSMEPSALVNIGGNIVRDRKSIGRQSIGRSMMKSDLLDKKGENDVEFTPVAKWNGLQDEEDFEDDESELSTPDYLAAPDKLVQMTAPSNRVRKLDLQKDESKNRRMTSFWEGGE